MNNFAYVVFLSAGTYFYFDFFFFIGCDRVKFQRKSKTILIIISSSIIIDFVVCYGTNY